MEAREYVLGAVVAVREHPGRALASSLGVFWGAVALVLLLAWGSGFHEFARRELTRFGRGQVLLIPAVTSSGFPGQRKGVPVRISRSAVGAAEGDVGELVEALLPEHFSKERVLVEARGRWRRLHLVASDERYARYRNLSIEYGRPIDLSDVERDRPVAALGHDAAEDLFGSANAAVGEAIRVDGRPFRVVGVMRKKGQQNLDARRPDDRILLIPITSAEARLGYDEEALSRVLLVPWPGADSEAAVRAALEALGRRSRFHPDDQHAIRVVNMTKLLGSLDLFYAGFMVFVGLAGTVTLLVAALGIANYHLALMEERTVEYGVARAVGARRGTLVAQTLVESLFLSVGSSVFGLLVGIAICWMIGQLPLPEFFPRPSLSLSVSAVTILALSSAAGLAALLPGLRAGRLDVGSALRAGG